MKKLEKKWLARCKICSNPFFKDLKSKRDICENCRELEERRKRTASLKIKQVEVKKEIDKMETQLKVTMSKRRKEEIKHQIKEKSYALTKSIELLVKYEETGDEKYIEQYINLFQLLKKDS